MGWTINTWLDDDEHGDKQMSETKQVKVSGSLSASMTVSQFQPFIDLLTQSVAMQSEIAKALWAINEQLKPLDNVIDNQTTEITKWLGQQDDTINAGFARVAEAIANLTLPPPQPKPPQGVIMARFKVAADNPDFTIELVGSGFTDQEGNPAGAGDIDLTVESSNPDAVSASISGQVVSEDGNSVTAQVAVHVGAPATDFAVLAYAATNRDTGGLAAAGSDEFLVGAGEASVGTVTSSVPLTPEA